MPNVLILKFPYSSVYGGGEKHTITLVEKLQPNYTFYLLSSCPVLLREFSQRHWPTQRLWAGTEPVTPAALLTFFFTAPIIWINLFWHVLQYKLRHHISVLFCLSLTEKVLLTPWARLLGIKVIWMEHLQIERSLRLSPLRLLYVLWSRLAVVVTVVEAVRDQLMHLGVPNDRIRVIYNAVNIKQFMPHPTPPERLTEEYRLLFIGRLAPEKGVDDLLTALASVKKIIPHVQLTIVGEGAGQADLETLTEELALNSIVRFVGFQTNIPEWLQNHDVLVLPAVRRETFGIVLAEALAIVKPVIATTIGGLTEVVSKHGWIVEPHEPMALAQAIIDVYENYPLAIHRAQAGRLRVLELFQEQRMVQEYATLFS
ncbi:MAG: glycosyltransferase family 4 protein [Candidatus Kerfeldbacteria bacterium]|nr:glycosyltransferase family 4 protein [Candidatus Kerfeldbacteria bacterium]